MSVASRLPCEVLEQVFLEFNSISKKGEIFVCLSVSKSWYQAMKGPALLDTIEVTRIDKLTPLLSFFMRNPSQMKHVKRLTFCLNKDLKARSKDLSPDQISSQLATVLFLIQALPSLRQLYDVPVLASQYDQILSAISDLKYLRSLSVTVAGTSDAQTIALKDVHSLAKEKATLKALLIEHYHSVPACL